MSNYYVSTGRYFDACPHCGSRSGGMEITYDVPPAEIGETEQTHWHCYGSLPSTLLTLGLYEPASDKPRLWWKDGR